MSHVQQVQYCIKISSLFPNYFRRSRVLDIGSLDINGSNRYLFDGCQYTGIDIGRGKNVDHVSKGHEWNAPPNYYDTIICTEVFEHDKYYVQTIQNAWRMLRPGGLFLFTCATIGRPEHGTSRTDMASSPFTLDYYCNVTEAMVRAVPGFNWQYCKFSVNEVSHDLQFFGFKPGAPFELRPTAGRAIWKWCVYFFLLRVMDWRNAFKKVFFKYQKLF